MQDGISTFGIIALMDTNSKPTAKRQPIFVFLLEAYLAVASAASVICGNSGADGGPALIYIVWGCILSTLGLLVAGIALLFCRRGVWAWTAIGFAIYGFLFVGLFLPTLAKARFR